LPLLVIDKLSANYGAAPALREVSLSVEAGSVVSLIGPSGSGKSTLLRTLVGLTPPVSGSVTLAGQHVDYRSPSSLKAARRRVGIVFQQYNLFQNMTALANIAITPIKVQGRPRAEVEAEAVALLEKVGLGDKCQAYPDQLSGGQQQRVAIVRALALKPELLLLDEVTAALDPELVTEVLDAIRSLAYGGMTMLIVSHEMRFVREVSHHVVMMDKGSIVETGTPDVIFAKASAERTRMFLARVRG
jgi:polar amino acid transport system ATP-binding protein